MISLARADIVCEGGGGFHGGMPKARDVDGKVIGDVSGTTEVGSEGEVPAETKAEVVVAETKAGVVAQIQSSYIRSLNDPGISMEIGSGVWSRGSLIESGVLGSVEGMSSTIGEGVCRLASESIVA